MKRLQTYFSILATLGAVLAGAIVLFVTHDAFEVPAKAYLILLPIALLVYTLSLIIGYFLSEPLALLIARTTNFRIGDDAALEPDGRMYEADRLSANFNALAQSAKAQQASLVLKSKRQSDFVGDIAHELRTPLTAIRGNAEMLQDPDLPPELHDRFVATIVSESERLGRMVKDLLALQHIENDQKFALSRVNLRDVAERTLDMLQPVLQERDAHASVEGEAPDVLGNADKLMQVLSNLVDNACHFIPQGGTITLELSCTKGNSVVMVKDNGSGFGDTDPALLFDRFYRTDFSRARNSGGSGLGLAIVKGIVEAHDGTVTAFNLPEGGACFMVAIPSIPA